MNLVNNRHYGCIQDVLFPEKAQMLYNTNESDIILRRSTEEATLPEAALVRRRQVTRNKGFDRMLRIQKRLGEDTIHYVAESILAEDKRFIHQSQHKALTVAALSVGYFPSLYIKRKLRKYKQRNY